MGKLLVDSSAWIHFFNQTSQPHFAAVTSALQEDRVVTCGLIVTEVIQGARNERERRLLIDHFGCLEYAEIDRADYAHAAILGFSLRRKGVTMKTIDLLLTHLALREDITILHDDSDFDHAARHTALRTINPS